MNDFIEKNYYEVLEVKPGSTIEEIEMAYTRAINTYKGDSAAMYSLLTDDECKEITNKIEEAYSVIGQAEKRVQYDKAKGFEVNTPITREAFSNKNEYSFEEKKPVRENSEVSQISAKSKFSLSFEIDTEFEKDIENCSSFTGDFLKSIREYKNVSIERMSDLTKVSKTHLKNLEGDEIGKLPADVYTRGFVFQYAKCLKLNPDLVAKSYMLHTKELKQLLNE